MPMTRRAGDVDLQPGDCFVGDARHRVRTLLGSCVSITLWCAAQRVGAMSHALLAQRPSGHAASTRYADDALDWMLAQLRLLGVGPLDCGAKVFGGGDMFPRRLNAGEVGRRNGEAARRLLQRHGIVTESESLFGEGHRQVLFDISTGRVWCRQQGIAR